MGDALWGLPSDSDGPTFAEPWQAEAFALTVRLHEAGCFSWPEWAAMLAALLREVRDRGDVDDGSRYYDHLARCAGAPGHRETAVKPV